MLGRLRRTYLGIFIETEIKQTGKGNKNNPKQAEK